MPALAEPPVFRLPEGGRYLALPMADGCRVRAIAVAPQAPVARVLLMTGRADFLEKWADVIGALLGLGLGVFAFDWRGQGGSDRAVANGAGHIDSFDTWLDDLDRVAAAALGEGQGPWVAIAHSMGAHLLLRWLAQGRDTLRLKGAVLTAPMVDLHMPRPARALTMAVARAKVRHGQGAAYAWGQGPYGPERQSRARMALLTSDPDRFFDEGRWVAADPALAVGGVSWGWLAAADASIAALAQADLSVITCPVLMLLAARERLVSNRAALALARRLPNCRAETVPGSGHEILREAQEPRQRALSLVAEFLARAGS